jgi:DNA ligase 1
MPDPRVQRRTLLLALGAWALGHARAAEGTPPALMLAKVWRTGMPLADYWVSEKYDGVRGFWDGSQLLTRGGRRVAAPAWFTAGWPAHPLDGELWAGRGRFEAAQSAVGRDVPDDGAWRGMRYMVFDLPGHPGPFDERLAALSALVAALGLPWVQAVPQHKVADAAALRALLKKTVKAGGEGLMLHRGASLYRGERNDDLLKFKPYDDAEAVVVAHLPGKGRNEGRLGALEVMTPEGLRFGLGTGLTDAQRHDPPPVGSTVTYRYVGLNASGVPRFASFLRVRTE